MDFPNNKHVYSMPSGLFNLRIALLSPIVNGSYLILTDTSIPLLESARAATTYAYSDLKSLGTPA